MTDLYDNRHLPITAPPGNAAPVTPDDTADLPYATRAIYVGTSGNLRVQTLEGQDVTYRNLFGTKVLRVTRVYATGTTAADIVAEW